MDVTGKERTAVDVFFRLAMVSSIAQNQHVCNKTGSSVRTMILLLYNTRLMDNVAIFELEGVGF